MPSLMLARHEPRAMALAAASQFASGALQSLVGLLLWTDDRPELRVPLAIALAASLAGAVVHGVLGPRLPWWSPYGGALTGTVVLLYVCDAMWGEAGSAVLVAQLVLIVLTVAVFFDRVPVLVHVGVNLVGWAVVCARNDPAVDAVASWLAVGPSMIVAAVVARWLVARLIGLVERDPLTGAANRATWNRLATEPATGDACVAVLDLDHFKQVNDRHGHAAGDELLRRATAAWRGVLRPGDVLARLGGDEFAVVLPRLTLHDGAVVAERLRIAVNGLASVTIGVAARRGAEPLEAVLARADLALYDAKRAGRGRVAVALDQAA